MLKCTLRSYFWPDCTALFMHVLRTGAQNEELVRFSPWLLSPVLGFNKWLLTRTPTRDTRAVFQTSGDL